MSPSPQVSGEEMIFKTFRCSSSARSDRINHKYHDIILITRGRLLGLGKDVSQARFNWL